MTTIATHTPATFAGRPDRRARRTLSGLLVGTSLAATACGGGSATPPVERARTAVEANGGHQYFTQNACVRVTESGQAPVNVISEHPAEAVQRGAFSLPHEFVVTDAQGNQSTILLEPC